MLEWAVRFSCFCFVCVALLTVHISPDYFPHFSFVLAWHPAGEAAGPKAAKSGDVATSSPQVLTHSRPFIPVSVSLTNMYFACVCLPWPF